jgi:uncharacterized protein YaaN involved in tellurite resistance
MTDIPDNVDLTWIARHLIEFRDEMRAIRDDMRSIRTDMDILIRSVIRLDHTVDALREDIKSLWLSQGDLRRRIEALEEARH